MSHPKSKFINKIQFDKVYYLTDENVAKQLPTNTDINTETGRPLNNIYNNNKIDTFFFEVIYEMLFESKNVHDNFIYTYPELLEETYERDIKIEEATTIEVSFLMAGASMQNMIGYYMYILDNGEIKILDNDGVVDDYYYKPTIIFPHAIKKTDHLNLGDTRKLKGNMPNGDFANVYIGFFLVSNGWYSYYNNGFVPDEHVLYTTVKFNQLYETEEYEMVKGKIYSINLKSDIVDDKFMIVVSFEDLFHKGVIGNDLDYNDCTLGLTIENSKVKNIDTMSTLVTNKKRTKELTDNIIGINDIGEYVSFDKELYTLNSDITYIFERHYEFTSETERDEMFECLDDLFMNYVISRQKIGNNKILMVYIFRGGDIVYNDRELASNADSKSRSSNTIRSNEDIEIVDDPNKADDLKIGKYDKYIKIYLMEMKYNSHKLARAKSYKKKIEKNLKDNIYTEHYKLYNAATNENIISVESEVADTKVVKSKKFKIIGNGIMTCNRGKSHLPFKSTQTYNVYTNKEVESGDGLVINVRMDEHPDGYQSGKKTFVRYISFIVNESEKIVIDLADISLYSEYGVPATDEYVNNLNLIDISDIFTEAHSLDKLKGIFNNNKDITYRIIIIDSFIFYCVRLGKLKNLPTLVYLNSDFNISWLDNYNITSGTYYNKKKFYEIDNL